jgi:hypothetical protein
VHREDPPGIESSLDLTGSHPEVEGLLSMGQRVLPRGEPVERNVDRLHITSKPDGCDTNASSGLQAPWRYVQAERPI